jgi:NADH-quinone oxidoreductase subunit E
MVEEKVIQFSEEVLGKVKDIIKRYPEGQQKSALLPVLHFAQAEFDGWLSIPVMDYVASLLGITPVEVYEVATFYSMFNTKPVGRCVISMCQTSACCLNAAEPVISHAEKKLGIKAGETTPDGKFTLKVVECLAACGKGPVWQIGSVFYENMTAEKADDLLDYLKQHDVCSHRYPLIDILINQ